MTQTAHSNGPTFAEALVTTPPRERSGSRSGNRFAYQQSWALCLTLKLHETPGDYCVLFDVHDDVVALDDSANPMQADFYQVKTRASGNWTAHKLTVQDKGKGGTLLPSMLGKLYDHYIRFPGLVRSMRIVSNAHFDLATAADPKGKDRDSICMSDLETAELQGLSDKLQAEHALPSPPAGVSITHVETTGLSLTDHEVHSQGVVCDFLSKQGDGSIPPQPFHRSVKAEIQRRNNREGVATTFEELRRQKGLTRAELQSMIDGIQSQKSQEDLVVSIRGQFCIEKMHYKLAHAISSNVRPFLAKRFDQTDLILVDAVKRAKAEIAAMPVAGHSDTPITDALEHLTAVQAPEWDPIRAQYSLNFLKALFTVLLYEQQVSPPHTQPTEKNV